MKIVADPTCEKCGGTGIIEGETFEVFPDDPGAAWHKNNDRLCVCVPRVLIIDDLPYDPAKDTPEHRQRILDWYNGR